MKKVLFFLVAVLLLTQTVLAGGGGQQSQQQKVVLRWASVLSESNTIVQMMNMIAEEVNSKTNGRVEIQVFPNGVLGSSRDMAEGVQAGMVDMIVEGASFYSGSIPMVSILEAPFVYRDPEHISKVYKSAFGDKLKAEFLKDNLRILGALYYGTRHLTTGNIPVNSVRDVVGLRIRVPEIIGYMEMINSWNARATPMALAELYMALHTGVVDGQENPLPTIYAQKFYEVQKYVILTGHIINPNFIFINENSWKKLSPEDQLIVQAAMDKGTAWNDAELMRQEESMVAELAALGMTFITPDRESFRAVTGPWLVERFEADWGKGTWDEIQNVR